MMPTTGNPPGARCGAVTTGAYPGKSSPASHFGGYARWVLTNGLALLGRARGALDVLVREMLKFGVVGAVAFVIDLGGYNLLVFGPHLLGMFGQQSTQGVLHDKPLTARIIAATVSTVVAWVGNRLWTFRHRRNRQAGQELALYLLFNVVAMVISVACLGISRYVFDLHTQLADNLTNIFGIVLGTLFRFWSYRKFVFAGMLDEEPAQPAGPDSTELDDSATMDRSTRLDRSAGLDRPAGKG
jgi:putative flippase GtrA